VRLSLLCASSALAASLLLSACSTSGTSQTIPGGSQSVGAMGHHGPQFVVVHNGGDAASCPSSLYLTCVNVSKKKGGSVTICISSSGNCTSGLVGDWNWTTSVTNLKGKNEDKKIKNSWDPNPGNPSTDTFTVHGKLKASKQVKYVANVTACEVTNPSSCLTTAVGLVPKR
jgi:hypothetical protein